MCLRLPMGLERALPAPLRKSLYVRTCYRQLFDLMQQRCSQAAEPLAFIITGTPGVGKSAAALYFIQQLSKQQQLVCYERQGNEGRVLLQFDFRGGAVKAAQAVSLPPSGSELRNEMVWGKLHMCTLFWSPRVT